MSFLKRVLEKERAQHNNENITESLIREIDELVAKKVDLFEQPTGEFLGNSSSSKTPSGTSRTYRGGATPLKGSRGFNNLSDNYDSSECSLQHTQSIYDEDVYEASIDEPTTPIGRYQSSASLKPRKKRPVTRDEDYWVDDFEERPARLPKRAESPRSNSREQMAKRATGRSRGGGEQVVNYRFSSNQYTSEAEAQDYSSPPAPRKKREVLRDYGYEDGGALLPFEDQVLRPKIKSRNQLVAVLRRSLRPALERWIDENLDNIIQESLRKRL